MPAELSRLTYISRFAGDLGSQELDALVEQSAEKNALQGITGVLMASGGVFYQVLEGPKEALASLYERILKDERHQDVLLLTHDQGLTERSFEGWSMRAISADAIAERRLQPVREKLESVVRQRERLDATLQDLHKQVWAQLDRIVRTGDKQVGLRDGVVTEIR